MILPRGNPCTLYFRVRPSSRLVKCVFEYDLFSFAQLSFNLSKLSFAFVKHALKHLFSSVCCSAYLEDALGQRATKVASSLLAHLILAVHLPGSRCFSLRRLVSAGTKDHANIMLCLFYFPADQR